MKKDRDSNSALRLLRSYGRRKGKRLSPRKARLISELLPRLRPDLITAPPDNLATLFPVQVRSVWLEIGFGAGEHLIWQARHNPDVGFIGCEPFVNGVAALLGGIEDHSLGNVLVYDDDARDVLAWCPERAISKAFVLFPDPWPKKRQAKRRLLSPDFARALARAIRPGGELRFASDDLEYAGQALRIVNGCDAFRWPARRASDWRERPGDWPQTRYERKALSEGRKPAYFKWQRL